jgi:ribonuclease HI
MTGAQLDRVDIYSDGACSGNPGPGGWGALLVQDGVEKEICGGAPQTTNNRMEMTAAIQALKALKRRCNVHLHTDSLYLREGVTTWIHGWKRNGWRTSARKPVKNQDLWMELDALMQRQNVSWHWVKGHSGHKENDRADQLANQGMAPFRAGSA